MSFRAATETTNLGRYHVVKRLAAGGMADVLLARTVGVAGFERHVVIKRIHAALGDEPRYRKMFLDEARLAATLHHANIVQVNDIGEDGGEYFFAMEYVHGEDARTLLMDATERGHLIPIEHVITIVMAAAAGLHHAHEQCAPDRTPLHIVHRDVSPANILIGYDGSVKVADFGIAQAARRSESTQSGVLKGKAAYMSPEQCNCEPLDRRSDVFSLGIVLYELATVHPCFRGENDFQTMTAIVRGVFDLPRSLNAAIPHELEAIIIKALAPSREDRYATCDEMRRALEELAAKAGLRTSQTALADYMKQQFGSKPEPWIADADPNGEIQVTGSSPLDLVLELKLPEPARTFDDDDSLSIPIERLDSQGMAPLEKPDRHRSPVKSTLPLRALRLVPPAAAPAEFPRASSEVLPAPAVVEPSAAPLPPATVVSPLVAFLGDPRRRWLVVAVAAVVLAALVFVLVLL